MTNNKNQKEVLEDDIVGDILDRIEARLTGDDVYPHEVCEFAMQYLDGFYEYAQGKYYMATTEDSSGEVHEDELVNEIMVAIADTLTGHPEDICEAYAEYVGGICQYKGGKLYEVAAAGSEVTNA